MDVQCHVGWKAIWLLFLILMVEALNLGYFLEKYYELPGIYFLDKGTASVYNTEWKTVVQVDVKLLDNNTVSLREYVDQMERLCKVNVIANWTACVHFRKDAEERLLRLERSKDLPKEIMGHEQDT